jgi:hypothetical protein
VFQVGYAAPGFRLGGWVHCQVRLTLKCMWGTDGPRYGVLQGISV